MIRQEGLGKCVDEERGKMVVTNVIKLLGTHSC